MSLLGIYTHPSVTFGAGNSSALTITDKQVLTLNESQLTSNLNIDDLVTLTGVSAGDINLGTFSGSTISDNQTIKGALQDLESQVEVNASNITTLQASSHVAATLGVGNSTALTLSGQEFIFNENTLYTNLDLDDLQVLTGVLAGSNDLGTFPGSIISDSATIKIALQELELALETSGAVGTDLAYTASPTDGTVTSNTGTDATLPLADATNAGLLAPADFSKLGHITVTQAVNLDTIETNANNVPALITLSGVAGGSTDLGTFSGTTITDNVTVKVALQELETAVEGISGVTNLGYTASPTDGTVTSDTGTDATLTLATGVNAGLLTPADFTKLGFITITQAVDLDNVEQDLADVITLTGVAANSTHLGTFTGTTITDNVTVKVALQELEVAVEAVPVGDFVGPASSTDHAIVRFDGVTGKLGQNSGVTIDDSNNIDGVESINLNAISAPAHSEGTVFYDTAEKTLTLYNDRTTPALQIGREQWLRVKNNTGVQIDDGSVVYISGEDTGVPEITLAQANAEATSSATIGVVTEDIAHTSEGECTVSGIVRGLDTSSYSSGDLIYLSPTVAGGFTSTKPTSPDYAVLVGTVVTSNVATGTIAVSIDDGSGNKEALTESWNGATLGSTDVTVTSDGATITLNWELTGGGDIEILFDGEFTTFDATPTATVTLTAGTDTTPQLNYIYVLQSTGLLTASTAGWPAAQHAPVATVVCQSAASLQTDGAYKVHAWTDHIIAGDDMGHISHLNYWIRNQPATWLTGVSQTLTITPGSPDTVIFTTGSGNVLQLHDHSFPAFGGTPTIYVINDSVTPYTTTTDLATELTDSTGASMSASYFSLVIWGVVSEDEADCKLMLNLPGGSYGTEAALLDDAQGYANYSIPDDFIGTGFLISELKLRHQAAGGGTWTSIQEVDLRGLLPAVQAGGSGGGGGVTDHGNLTGLGDDDHSIYAYLAGRTGGQTLIGGDAASDPLTLRSTSNATKGNVVIEGPQWADEDDATRKVTIDVSNVATSTTRTWTVPNRDIDFTAGGTFVEADTIDTFTNKTFDANGTGNSLSNVETADIAAGSKSGADTTLITGTAGTNGNLAQWNVDGDAVDSSLATADVVTGSSTDTFTNKTFDANGTGNSLSNVDVADLASGTDGELITWDAAGLPATVAVGTANQVLTSNGAGAAPTFQDAAGGGLSWSEVTGTTQSMAVENAYIANNAAEVDLTLPATAALGERVRIAGKGAGGWKISQNAGQTIHFGDTDSTTGVGGTLTASDRYGTAELVCITANTDWVVLYSVGAFVII